VRHEDRHRVAIQETNHRVVVDVRHRVVLGVTLPSLDATNPRRDVTGWEMEPPARRQEAEPTGGVHCGQVTRDRAIGDVSGKEPFQVGKALMVAVDHDDGASEAEAAFWLSSEDRVEPGGGGLARPLSQELELTGVRLAVPPGRIVELAIVGEGPHVAAEECRLEPDAEFTLPAGEDAEGELEVPVAVTDDRQH